MKYHVILIPLAEEDILEAWHWYKSQSVGLEEKFWDALYKSLLRIAKHPSHFTPVKPDVRVALMKRFPYKIIYYTNEAMKRVEVIAVVHNKRHPGFWKKRV